MNNQNIKKIKNIAIIHPTLAYKGGAENVIISTVRECQKLDIKCSVYTNTLREDLTGEINQIQVPLVLNPLLFKKTAQFILDEIKHNSYDAIVMHNFPSSIFWGKVFDIACRQNIALPKIFWYCHEPSVRLYGSDEDSYNKLSKTLDPIARATMKLDKYGVSNVDYIFTNSVRTQKHVETVYNRESVVVYPCSDYDSVQSCDQDKKHFLHIGRIEKPKNIDIAINAFQRFLSISDDKSVQFLIAGKGRYEKYISEHIDKLNLQNNVKILGYISEEQKHDYIESAYAIVSIADKEPFGLNAIEAWAFGSTAIISRYSGAAEIVCHDKNAIVVEPRDEKSITNAMLCLVGDKSYRDNIYKNGSAIIKSQKFSAYSYTINLLAEIQKHID